MGERRSEQRERKIFALYQRGRDTKTVLGEKTAKGHNELEKITLPRITVSFKVNLSIGEEVIGRVTL